MPIESADFLGGGATICLVVVGGGDRTGSCCSCVAPALEGGAGGGLTASPPAPSIIAPVLTGKSGTCLPAVRLGRLGGGVVPVAFGCNPGIDFCDFSPSPNPALFGPAGPTLRYF